MAIPNLAPGKIILGEQQRLSESALWQLQTRYFEQQGVNAWRSGTVPHYITSNPFIARAYAQVVCGYLRDCRAARLLDETEPIYILELGTGSGRFAFHFFKKLAELLPHFALQNLPIKIVLTDFAQETIDYWTQHPVLRPLVEDGLLDFARFDATRDDEITLLNTGARLVPSGVRNPLIVLANYFFDSIPQDVFYVKDGQLHEGLVTVAAKQPDAALDTPDMLNHVEIAYEHRKVGGAYYADTAYNQILSDYCARLDDTTFLFPIVGLRCIESLSRLADGQMLLLSADKGFSGEDELRGQGDPGLTLHGSFSMMVNYHALGQYVLNQGGEALHPGHPHQSLNVSAFIPAQPPNGAAETRLMYALAVAQFSPDDFFTLKKGIEPIYYALTLAQLLAHLRLSGWDANIFQGCWQTLVDRAGSLEHEEKQSLYEAIEQVWDIYYPIGEPQDLAFNIGMLLYGMAYYAEALVYFERSVRLYGDDPGTSLNRGLCCYNLCDPDTALAYVDEALALDPNFETAQSTRMTILEEINFGLGR
jgi:tetratricopeptide (TPR) repeat protein